MFDYNATVVRIIGPLSFRLDIDLGFNVHVRETVRLDALAQPTRQHRGTVTGFVTQWLANHETFTVRSLYSREKYGRWLVLMTGQDGSVLNSELVTSGLIDYIDPEQIHDNGD